MFLCSRFLAAAWSIFFQANCTAWVLSSALASIAAFAFLMAVLRAVLRALLLAAFTALTLTLFLADLMLGMVFTPLAVD